MISFICPKCGEETELRKRVTVSKRHCGACGELITVPEIDRQLRIQQERYEQLMAQMEAERLEAERLSQAEKVAYYKAQNEALLREEARREGDRQQGFQYLAIFLAIIFIFVAFSTVSSLIKNGQSETAGGDTEAAKTPKTEPPQPTVYENSAQNAEQTPNEAVEESTEQGTSSITEAEQTWFAEPSAEVSSLIDSAIAACDASDDSKLSDLLQQLNSYNVASYHDNADATALNKEGLSSLKAKNYADAASQFAKAIGADKTDPKLFSNLGFAQMYLGYLEPAKKNLYQSLSLNPSREIAWEDLGQIFAKQRAQNRAVACFLIAHRISNGKAEPYLKSLDKDDDVAIRLAGAAALQKLSENQNAETPQDESR